MKIALMIMKDLTHYCSTWTGQVLRQRLMGFTWDCALGIVATNLRSLGNILQKKAQSKEATRRAGGFGFTPIRG